MMSQEIGAVEDRYLAPGTKVRRDAYWNGEEHPRSEFGIVVHCWLDEEMGMFDCLIAFFGDVLPTGKPEKGPYILRYAAVGLAEIS
jgi:hypothetical protein